MPLRGFDADGPGEGTAYVAGYAALICAKAYKLAGRLDERERRRNPERLRTKDADDVYRLMASCDPAEASRRFDEGERVPEIADAVRRGRAHLASIREPLVALAELHYRAMLPARVVREAMGEWLDAFAHTGP